MRDGPRLRPIRELFEVGVAHERDIYVSLLSRRQRHRTRMMRAYAAWWLANRASAAAEVNASTVTSAETAGDERDNVVQFPARRAG